MLDIERRFYDALQASFVPALVTYLEDSPPVLVLEDLSTGTWPPPWREGAVESVLRTLADVHATPPPRHLRPIEDERERLVDGWATVAEYPDPLRSLRVCSRRWLDAALPSLRSAAEAAPIGGDARLHLDVRSDNVCFVGGRTVLVDWNQACIGNPLLEVAGWLPSLEVESGRTPEFVLPDCPPGFPALLAGYFGARAGLPPPETAPFVRPLQLAQLRAALPWAARALGLPAPR